MRAAGWRTGIAGVLWLLCLPSFGVAASVQLQWEYPVTPALSRFRIYRVSGSCPASALLPQQSLRIASVDSQETVQGNFAATKAIDGNPATFWHTQFTSPIAPLPHILVLDLGSLMWVDAVHYLPRQDGRQAGNIARYEVSVSVDNSTWDLPVAAGTFPATSAEQRVRFTARTGRYVRLTGLSEVVGDVVTNAAEVRVAGAPLVTSPVAPIGEVARSAGSLHTFTDATVPSGSTNCWYVKAQAPDGTESVASNPVQVP